MLSLIRRSKPLASMLVVAFLLSLGLTSAAASEPTGKAEAEGRDVEVTGREQVRAESTETPPTVSYAGYEGSINLAEPMPEPAYRPRSVARMVASVKAPTSTPLPPPAPRARVASTAPMTAGEKFEAWIRSDFMSPGAYGSAVFRGFWKELNDNDDHKEDTVENYFADSATRVARAFTSSATYGFYEDALLPSLFRQDPRYHRSGKTGAGAKIGYAVTRVFVTQGDRCACNQVNASFLLGGAAGALTANLWERSERTGPVHTTRRYLNHILVTAFFNVVREFVGGQ